MMSESKCSLTKINKVEVKDKGKSSIIKLRDKEIIKIKL